MRRQQQQYRIPSLMVLLAAVLPTEIKEKADPQTFEYMNRHTSGHIHAVRVTLHTQRMEPRSRKMQNWEGQTENPSHLFNFGMVFMMALKAGFNEKQRCVIFCYQLLRQVCPG